MESKRFRHFYMDMNAFYTSVEQEERVELRGQPTIVVPLSADNTCAIASSYEAKALGIKTGTSVRMARLVCPGLHVVEARPELYISYHTRLVEILQNHFSAVKILSVDEMAARIPAFYNAEEKERTLAVRIKQQITKELGPCLRNSVGIAQNVFLAKVAAETYKPDGLTIMDDFNRTDILFRLRLTELPGIGSRMKRRLERHGIATVEALWNASPLDLRQAWGSVVGVRWHYMLRGSQECDYQGTTREVRKSVSHSHVLPPEFRTLHGAKEILLQLCARALKRLRAYNQAAGAVQVYVKYYRPGSRTYCSWTRRSHKHLHANDEGTWLRILRPLLAAMPDLTGKAVPKMTAIVFTDLLACPDVNLSLFEDGEAKARLAATIDAINHKGGAGVGRASLYEGKDLLPFRIPFGLTAPVQDALP